MPNTVTVTINIGGDYLKELKERLVKYGISQGELARQMGVDKSYFSRMFNKQMTPRMGNVQKIESAIVVIRRRHTLAKRKDA